MKYLKTLCAGLLLLALAGCTSVGLAPAQGLDEKIAYAHAALDAVEISAAQALTAHTITAAEAQTVLTSADQAFAVLDAAQVASKAGDTSTAAGKLALATAALTQLQTFLTSKGIK